MTNADQTLVHPRADASAAPARAARPDARPGRASGVRVELALSSELGAVEQEWRRFEQVADCTAFQSFDWLRAWQKHIGSLSGTVPAIVVGRRPAGDPLFIIPLATRRSGMISHLTFLGRDLGDYNAPLLAPDFERVVGAGFPHLWNDILELVQCSPEHGYDLVLLDKMPERVGTQRNPFLQLDVSLNPSGAYLTTLAGDWDSFYAAKRSASTRRRDRSKRRRLAEHGEVRMVTPENRDEIARTLATLMAQKQRSFARMGVPDLFARPGYRDFFFDIATGARHLAHVSRLEIGPTLAAANLGLEFRGGYYHVLASYDDGPVARFGPGAAHLHDLMRRALDRNCTFFDFTIGDEPYKRDWSDTEVALYDHVAAAGWRGQAAAAALKAARRAKRAIKQSSSLWSALSRVRPILGAMRRRATARPPDGGDQGRPS